MAEDWARLADAVFHRRKVELRWSQDNVREAGGPSDVVLSRVERNEHESGYPRPDTLQKLDEGLRWQPGSAVAVLNGGNPIPLPDAHHHNNGVSDASTEDLLSELWLRILPGTDALAERRSADDSQAGRGVSAFREGLSRDVREQSRMLRSEDDDQRRQGRS